MGTIVLGLDQGTSSTRCLAFDRAFNVIGAGSAPVQCTFPSAGAVEQSPLELVDSTRSAITAALTAAGASASDVVALGIAAQTETFVIAERAGGAAIHPALVWQDRRTADRCEALLAAGQAELVRTRTGLELDPTFPATKLSWLLDHVPGARERASTGELVYHDVAGWLVRSLTGAELCDIGNAGRSLLCGRGADLWDPQLLELFGIPRALMPRIVDSDRVDARCTSGTPLPGVPVTAMLGDQQASLFALRCVEPGQAKLTLGTGAFLLVQAGDLASVPPPGVLGSCAWRIGGQTSFALEGFVPAAASAVDYFAELGLLPPAAELDQLLAAAGAESGSIACVPCLQGLGTPSWDAGASAALLGLTRASTRAQIARAVLDGVVHQIVDAIAAIAQCTPIEAVLLDGGLSRSRWLVQRIADLAGVEVRRAASSEATALGAAMAAGLAAGHWQAADFAPPRVDQVARPAVSAAERRRLRADWSRALALVSSWR